MREVAQSTESSYTPAMARDPDTEMGGKLTAFPPTPSAVLGVASDDPVQRARAFSRLVHAYWKPVYKRVRCKFNRTNEQAKDTTQSFFAQGLEKGTFAKFDSERSPRFRTFVRTCIDNFVKNELQASGAQKRGGGFTHISLDFEGAEQEVGEAVGDLDDLFNADFAKSLLAAAEKRMEDELTAKGKLKKWRVFCAYEFAEDKPTYREVGEAFDMNESNVTNTLHAVRKRFRRVLLEILKEVTANEESFRSEALELFGIEADT